MQYGFALIEVHGATLGNKPSETSMVEIVGKPLWGLSRGFEQHAASLRNGLRVQAQTRPARGWERGSEHATELCGGARS